MLLPRGSGWVHLGTVGRDGGPHVTPVLLCIHDERLLFSITGRQKRRNLARDARVCVSVARDADLAHVVVWGDLRLRVDAEAEATWRAMMQDALGSSAFGFSDRLSEDGTALGELDVRRWRGYGLPAADPDSDGRS